MKATSAFTLVEMLVAAVVGAILIVLVAQMATTGLQSVGIAGGRMVSASKMHTLRSHLAADLALLPNTSLGLSPDLSPLKIETQGKIWTLTLVQSDSRPGSTWKQIIYRWNPDRQTLDRREHRLDASDQEAPAQVLVTGLIDWQVDVLTDPAADQGRQTWNNTLTLPAALHCQARLSSVNEEGRRSALSPAAEKGRDYQWRLAVAEGGGSAP